MLKDIDPGEVGVAFDIRHATATGGESWQVLWNVVQPHLQMVYVKDFHWKRRSNSKTGAVEKRQTMENVALGQGQVHPSFFPLLARVGVPISVHVEYLRTAGLRPNLKALESDLQNLKKMMSGA